MLVKLGIHLNFNVLMFCVIHYLLHGTLFCDFEFVYIQILYFFKILRLYVTNSELGK